MSAALPTRLRNGKWLWEFLPNKDCRYRSWQKEREETWGEGWEAGVGDGPLNNWRGFQENVSIYLPERFASLKLSCFALFNEILMER